MVADAGTAVLALHEVTHHAVIRYCERILGVELPAEEHAGRSIAGIAEALCRRAGTTGVKVATRILTPTVAAAVAMAIDAAINVKTPEFTAVVKRGCVVTIEEPKERPRLRLKARSENRRRPTHYRRRNHA